VNGSENEELWGGRDCWEVGQMLPVRDERQEVHEEQASGGGLLQMPAAYDCQE